MKRTLAAAFLTAALVLAAAPPLRAGVGMGTIEEHPAAARERWREKAEEAYKEGMKARAAGDTTNAVRFLLRCANMGKMRLDSKYPEMAFNTLKVIVEEARKELLVASKERKSMERLRERRYEAWQEEVRRAEIAEADDLIMTRTANHGVSES